jgi:hypothetical protein
MLQRFRLWSTRVVKREAGSGKREAGSGKREAGSGKRKLGMVAGATDHGGHDGNEFRRFLLKRYEKRGRDAAFFAQEFKPEHTFVGFLESATELGNELPAPSSAALWAGCARLSRSTRLTFRSCARRFLDMRGDRGSRAKQLFTKDADFLMVPWKADIKPNDGRSMPLGPVSKLFRQSSAHLISTFTFRLSTFIKSHPRTSFLFCESTRCRGRANGL